MSKCIGIMGRIFGHRFRPVITLSASTFNSAGVQCKAHAALDMAEKYRAEIFHGCICQRCGMQTESQGSVPPRNDEKVKPGVHNCTWDNRQLGDPVIFPLANVRGGNDEK